MLSAGKSDSIPFFFVDTVVAHGVYLCQQRLQGGTHGKKETVHDVSSQAAG